MTFFIYHYSSKIPPKKYVKNNETQLEFKVGKNEEYKEENI